MTRRIEMLLQLFQTKSEILLDCRLISEVIAILLSKKVAPVVELEQLSLGQIDISKSETARLAFYNTLRIEGVTGATANDACPTHQNSSFFRRCNVGGL